MADITRQVRAWGRAGAARLAPTVLESVAEVPRLRRQVDRLITRNAQLNQRIDQLDADLQESRQLHARTAEIADVVVELLVPAADRDDERLRAALERYERRSF